MVAVVTTVDFICIYTTLNNIGLSMLPCYDSFVCVDFESVRTINETAARVTLLFEDSIICNCALLETDMKYISYMVMVVLLCACC